MQIKRKRLVKNGTDKGDYEMNQKSEEYVMNQYGKKSTFASFLPGIAGVRGIPIWCYYVNN